MQANLHAQPFEAPVFDAAAWFFRAFERNRPLFSTLPETYWHTEREFSDRFGGKKYASFESFEQAYYNQLKRERNL